MVGSTRCRGNVIQKCNQYYAWEVSRSCHSPMVCLEPLKGYAFCGKKSASPATQPQESCESANTYRCSGQTIQRCGEEHIWEFTVNCSDPLSCVERKDHAFCSIKSIGTSVPSATSAYQPREPTSLPEEYCSVVQSTRCGGQFTNTVQQCGSDRRWHFQEECASDQVCSFHHDRAQCDWLTPGDTSLRKRDEKRGLDFCGVAYATRCHNNNIEYCEPWDFRWHYQSLCRTHDHQRCAQYLNHAVCENWGKGESAPSIEGQVTPQEIPQEAPQQEKRVEGREECGVFYATRCQDDTIQYCEPWDRQWHHQSVCDRKLCMQAFNFARCRVAGDPEIPNGGRNPEKPPAKREEKRDDKGEVEMEENRESCSIFYATRCHGDEIQYCEPWDRRWRRQSECSCKVHKICRQVNRWNAVCEGLSQGLECEQRGTT